MLINMDKNRKKQLDEIVTVIKDNIDPVIIYLFGSLASGDFQRDSDIDLLIVAPSKDRPLERRLKLRKLLIEYDRHLGLDLLVYTPEEYNMLINEPSSFGFGFGSTHSWIPYLWTNGPLARQLGIDSGQGLISHPANAAGHKPPDAATSPSPIPPPAPDAKATAQPGQQKEASCRAGSNRPYLFASVPAAVGSSADAPHGSVGRAAFHRASYPRFPENGSDKSSPAPGVSPLLWPSECSCSSRASRPGGA